jgi:hypothetical protein
LASSSGDSASHTPRRRHSARPCKRIRTSPRSRHRSRLPTARSPRPAACSSTPTAHRPLSPSRTATFGALCRDCPLRARCTTSKTGRSLILHERDDLLRAVADELAGALADAQRQDLLDAVGHRIETFGKVIGITRQVLINDDLDAFTAAGIEPAARRVAA